MLAKALPAPRRIQQSVRTSIRRMYDRWGFDQDAGKFLKFLQTVPEATPPSRQKVGPAAGIVVSPWQYTAVPWFSITLAYLYRQLGYAAELIWDDLPHGDLPQTQDQNHVINRVLAAVSSDFKIHRLSESAAMEISVEDLRAIHEISALNAVNRHRTSVATRAWTDYRDEVNGRFQKTLSRIHGLLSASSFGHLVVPGGVYGNSSLFYLASRKSGLRVASFDSGEGDLILGVDAVAAHLMDVPKILQPKYLETSVLPNKDRIVAAAKLEFATRARGQDKYRYQAISAEEDRTKETFDILIPLNVDWDTAALGKHRCFQSSHAWVIETIRFIIDHTDATVAVRQHPIERHKQFRSKHDLKSELNRLFGATGRVRYIPGDEKISTYRLFSAAKVILPFTSTVGIEGAVSGRHVILESDAYYSGFPFAQKASSKEDYFQKIQHALSGPPTAAESQLESAWLCYFYSKIANEIQTEFTPMPGNFRKWVGLGFAGLTADRVPLQIVESLATGTPALVWRTEQLLAGKTP